MLGGGVGAATTEPATLAASTLVASRCLATAPLYAVMMPPLTIRPMLSASVRAGVLVLLSSASAAFAAEPEIDMQWGVKIPLRDGVRLNATVFKPHASSQRLPVVFTLTPYISDTYYARARYFAQHGYVFALVDVRGRG